MNIRRILGGSLTVASRRRRGRCSTPLTRRRAPTIRTPTTSRPARTRRPTSRDVFVFPSPVESGQRRPRDERLADHAGRARRPSFDPTLMWQFKISHGADGRSRRSSDPVRRHRHRRGPDDHAVRTRPNPNEVSDGEHVRRADRLVHLQHARRSSATASKCSPARAPTRSSSTCSVSSRSWATATTRLHTSETDPGPDDRSG